MDKRIAAYGVIRDGESVLLVHWNEHGRRGWTIPGGGLEGREHPLDAAIREIYEETGYHAEMDELIGIDSMIVPEDQRHQGTGDLYTLRVVYRARITGGQLRHEVGGSSDQAKWWPLAEIPRLNRVSLVDIALRLDAERPRPGRV